MEPKSSHYLESGVAVQSVDVTKRFGSFTAVSGLSLSIKSGEIYGLLGPNGAGKTTTIRMLMNILIPDEGYFQVLGQRMNQDLQKRIGYLPEERGIYVKMKIVDFLLFIARLKGVDTRTAKSKIHSWLEELGLIDWVGKKIEDLSKGMQQKIQFIATVLHEPDLIILDEPFSGLDPVNTNNLKDILIRLNHEGKTIIFSTHIMEQVEKLCEQICLINRGMKVVDGKLSEVKKKYGHNNVIISFEGQDKFLDRSDLIASRDLYGNYVELKLKDGADPQELLHEAIKFVRVKKFEVVEPTLNDIFIDLVGRKHEENTLDSETGIP
jgi:ABC-2 type transport system ATP-binding protein